MNRRRLLLTTAIGAAAGLAAGCATLQTVDADVSSFGEWPAGRPPGRYAFERLPSQEARAADAEALEQAARPALEKAGFVPAAPGQEPDVLVQLGARFTQTLRSPWDDPLWWHGGVGRWRYGPWIGPRWGLTMRLDPPRYELEVALLLRDRASGKPLYETRAATETGYRADGATLRALLQAALADFPRLAISPRRVSVPVTP